MTSNSIKVKFDEKDYSEEYQVVCICSTLQDYRLSWHLNRLFDINLEKFDDFKYFSTKSKQEILSSLFLFYDNANDLHYHLISNRNAGQYLLPELKQVDYLLFLKGCFEKNQLEQNIRNISNIPNVIMAYTEEFSKIKDINILLAELEVHNLKFYIKNDYDFS